MLTGRFGAVVVIAFLALIFECSVWVVWRLALGLLRRDIVALRLICAPLMWLHALLMRVLGGERDDEGQYYLMNRAASLRASGNLEGAVKLYARLGNRMSFRRDRQLVAEILLDRATCLEQLGRTDEALLDWAEGDTLARAYDSSFLQVRAAHVRGLIELRRGDNSSAIAWLERARAAAKNTGLQRIPAVSGVTETLLGLYRQQHDYQKAIALCLLALDDWALNGDKYKQADTVCEMAELYALQGDLDSSLHCLRRVQTLCEVLQYRAGLDRLAAILNQYHPGKSLTLSEPITHRTAEILQFPGKTA